MKKKNSLIKTTTKKVVKNPIKTLYLIGGIFGIAVLYKTYKMLFTAKDPQENASTNFNPALLSSATMSDVEIYSTIDLIMSYINPTFYGTDAEDIIDLINNIGIPNFVKVNYLFEKKPYNKLLGEVGTRSNLSDFVFPLYDLKTILTIEFANESENLKEQLKDIYSEIETF